MKDFPYLLDSSTYYYYYIIIIITIIILLESLLKFHLVSLEIGEY